MADMYGEQFGDNAHDAIIGLLEDLVDEMSADDPKPTTVYPRHHVAGVVLNSLSVGLDSMVPEWTGVSNGPWPTMIITLSIRVHTAYGDDSIDDRKTSRLMQSVVNKLFANLESLGDGYHIRTTTIDNRQRFDESYTGGGVVTAIVEFETYYDQE